MISYLEAIEQLPTEVKLPLMKAFELFKEEIAETVKKSDFDALKAVVGELAEAQRRTEQRVEELAEAQRRTEEVVRRLVISQGEMREQIGGLAHTVGYRLEDESFKALPALLKRDMDIEIIGRLKRDFIEIAHEKYLEVNIWGEARRDGREYVIVGEAKSQLKKKDVDDFIKLSDRIKKYITKDQIRILVTYNTSPQVQKYAKEKDIKIYFSYEF